MVLIQFHPMSDLLAISNIFIQIVFKLFFHNLSGLLIVQPCFYIVHFLHIFRIVVISAHIYGSRLLLKHISIDIIRSRMLLKHISIDIILHISIDIILHISIDIIFFYFLSGRLVTKYLVIKWIDYSAGLVLLSILLLNELVLINISLQEIDRILV